MYVECAVYICVCVSEQLHIYSNCLLSGKGAYVLHKHHVQISRSVLDTKINSLDFTGREDFFFKLRLYVSLCEDFCSVALSLLV